ncbi:MAG: alpha-glucosidase family protein [Alphaproteobacteria bacterium]|nr:alpha-glucosidase family protein [Alphaproteobacteria bacterium]MBU0803216.1 alpha-glucosidase family protein [Alphaproteobacteria bacterium]MBU0873904.1 alpha-glucosidase family protein [Alphaproteobacteria bacterium]MBU1400596.1 alpha-glucosidase family protein [Alphaproteobacteria bacterium]MBU1590469.1 alpha-glucosidase family protein [Alphaproteobacteria bacterium]
MDEDRPDGDWWRGCAIYQVYPRSFQDLSGNGTGDLKGVAQRVGHIAALGVDAVWLSPFFKSPMADMGYDVSDYRAVDPTFGTLEDFDALVAELHGHGLKLIIDQVLSHSSDRHPWFMESRASRANPRADWYVWADAKPDGTAPNNWLSVFGGPAWEWDSTRRQYYLHNFLASQPDLNFHNPEVQEALLGAMRFWLDRGVDGFRLDTVNYYAHDRWLRDNPPLAESVAGTIDETNPYLFQSHLFDKTQPETVDFLKRFRALLDEYAARASVGEVGDEDRSLQTVAAYTRGGDRLHMCYTFDLLGPKFSADHVRGCVEAFEAAVADGWVCWAFSNHDVVRHVSRWTPPGGDTDAVARFSIALLACLRGSICLYQGEELGLTEAEIAFEDLRDPFGIRFWPGFKGRDGSRTPMPWEAGAENAGFSTAKTWLPIPPEHRARAVDVEEADPHSVLARYREVLAFRKDHPALRLGSIAFLDAPEHVLAFWRDSGDERLFCAFNFGGEPVEWPLPPGIGTLEMLLDGEGRTVHDTVELPPLGVLVGRPLG